LVVYQVYGKRFLVARVCRSGFCKKTPKAVPMWDRARSTWLKLSQSAIVVAPL